MERMQIPRQLELPKRVAVQTIDDEAPELAAGLAYRFLFALFPFAIFVSALAAFVSQAVGLGDPTDEILGAVGDNLPPDVASQIAPAARAGAGPDTPRPPDLRRRCSRCGRRRAQSRPS